MACDVSGILGLLPSSGVLQFIFAKVQKYIWGLLGMILTLVSVASFADESE